MLSSAIEQAIRKAEHYPYIVRVGVFGSAARNEAATGSDLDIIIDYDNSSDDFLDNLDDFMESMERDVQGKIDYVTLEGLMKSRDESFKQEVLRDVKWIYNATG
ncbi:MAG: nucleotidyltransferase domain-containing protein [Defluviitaleaceae bacterium]|nr:nucleotidyltransferase domain-containing protein [Defluviitaleaceae bacterium]